MTFYSYQYILYFRSVHGIVSFIGAALILTEMVVRYYYDRNCEKYEALTSKFEMLTKYWLMMIITEGYMMYCKMKTMISM